MVIAGIYNTVLCDGSGPFQPVFGEALNASIVLMSNTFIGASSHVARQDL